MKKTAVYLRVSTDTQTVDGQRHEISARLPQYGTDAESVLWFIDEAEDSRTLDRPALDKLRKAVAAGKISTIVIQAIDRIGRNTINNLRLLEEWTAAGVKIISLLEGIDFGGPTGVFMATIFSACAEMFLKHNKERQAAGIAAARVRVAKGLQKDWHKNKKRSPKTAAKEKRAWELSTQGFRWTEIGQALGVTPWWAQLLARRHFLRYVAEPSCKSNGSSPPPSSPSTPASPDGSQS